MLQNEGDVHLGKPFFTNVKVDAQIIGQGPGKKIHIIKMKRRKHYRKQQGHRQYKTTIKITNIQVA